MMQDWFTDAKLGIFIHWGIYSVNGVPESWSWFGGQVSKEDYFDQLGGFTADKFDANQWGELFARAGAKYAVLTTKHHDGVALFDTKANDFSVVHQTPAKRDLIQEYSDGMRKNDVKVGFYFSHLDWHHDDYATVTHHGKPGEIPKNPLAFRGGAEDPEAWDRFVKFRDDQVEELMTNYNPDLMWFDGEWERSKEQWKMKELRAIMDRYNPECVYNARLSGYGDYETPEQGVPIQRPEGVWELCITVNDSWGYQVNDDRHKSVRQLVQIFTDTISLGGNLLLDIGPYGDGSLQPEQVARLEGLGAWIHKHSEAIYGTVEGMPHGHFYGASTLSKDRKTLYLFACDPIREEVVLKGIKNPIKNASVLGDGTSLTVHKIGIDFSDIPAIKALRVPSAIKQDDTCTVVKVEFEEPLELYRGKGREVED